MSNLHDRGTLRGTLQRNSGNYNDLINKPAINGHTLIGNQSGHALGLANEEDIINVEANPLGHATADLHKILVDDTIYSIPDVVVYGTASGDIATFDDGGDNKPLKSLKVAINPVQSGSGDPSPSNVRPISGWTGANIHVCGTNIYNENWESGSLNATTGLPVVNAAWSRSKDFIDVKPLEEYYFNFEEVSSSNTFYIFYYQKDETFISASAPPYSSNRVIQIPSNCEKIKVQYKRKYEDIDSYNVSINYPSTDTSYHAYDANSHVYQISWSEAGEVFGGEFEISDNGSSADRTYKSVDLGTLNWTKHSNGSFFYTSLNDAKYETGAVYTADAISSDYVVTTPRDVSTQDNTFAIGTYYLGTCTLYLRDSRYLSGTAQEFKQAMNGVQLVYALASPITFTLDSPLPTITTLLGTNNIWSDTGEIEECVYQRDINIALNKALSQ